tara:strand:- start:4278 stop:5759 length:1482 start_codon:yes stop_codon:yes gene_type:complete
MKFISSTNDIRKYLNQESKNDIKFENISSDTRSIRKGSLFIAIKGPNFDGNTFIDQAFKRGAVAALCSDKKYKNYENNSCIFVPSVKKALIEIATNICDEFKGKKILITGSAGKTTSTFLLSKSLPNCSSTIGNFNNEIGLPLSVMHADRDSEFLVLEAGAGKPGDIATLSQIVKPHIGLITSISKSHTKFLGDIYGVFNEKMSLVENIQECGTLILPFKDHYEINEFKEQFNDIEKTITKRNLELIFTNSDNPDSVKNFHRPDFEKDLSKMSFKWEFKHNAINEPEHFETTLVGEQNIGNIVLVAKCILKLGLSINLLKYVLINPEFGLNRSTHLTWINESHLIDDSYNANPSSVHYAIRLLSKAPMNIYKRRILVLGDMLELNESQQEHESIGNGIGGMLCEEISPFDSPIEVLITYGKMAKITADAARKSYLDPFCPYGACDNCNKTKFSTFSFNLDQEQEMKEFINEFIEKDDIVLLKGSRGMKMERFI